MPQMSPMNWILLFFIFNISVFLIMVKMFFIFNKIFKKKSEVQLVSKNFIYKL